MKWDHDIPKTPDFNRVPYREPEDAVYRDDVPDQFFSNPYYRALPGYRSASDVSKIIKANNKYPPAHVQTLPNLLRKEYIDLVDTALIPLRRHVALEEMVMVTIRNSYANRPIFVQENSAAEKIDLIRAGWGINRPSNFAEGSVGSGALFGDPGQGKTVILKRILMSCPQIIRHREFEGKALNVTQLAWLYISLPPKASTLALLVWITATLDYLLGTSYLQLLEAERTLTLKARSVARWLTLHAVGTIICDEMQNIKVGSQNERHLLENTLQELINYTYTRWLFVGTKASLSAVCSEALKRRLIGERGQKIWEPLTGDSWDEFITELWAWRVTSDPTPLSQELKLQIWKLTGGVPDYAKRLFTVAQSVLITSKVKDERLTPEVFRAAMEMLPDVMRSMAEKAARESRKKALTPVDGLPAIA